MPITKLNTALTIVFILLYLATAVVSCAHAIEFFNIGNNRILSTILAIAFELGQAGCLFVLLIHKKSKLTPWIMTGVLACTQCIGNIFCTYRHMTLHSADQIQYFTQSILFFIQSPDPQANTTIISYIIGGLLPLVCLGLTSLIVEINTSSQLTQPSHKDTNTAQVTELKDASNIPPPATPKTQVTDQMIMI